jgi:hypothetical protein
MSTWEHDDDLARAEELAEEVGAENEDDITRREAVEQALEDEGLSDEGEHIGEHID